uniref:Uncharacterized protein n=1 Tax=Aegilops tauschii subsp. strangulata TaxID=200361 RepID=A0A452YE42_AEGTS
TGSYSLVKAMERMSFTYCIVEFNLDSSEYIIRIGMLVLKHTIIALQQNMHSNHFIPCACSQNFIQMPTEPTYHVPNLCHTWICHLAVLQELCVVRGGRDSDLSVAGGCLGHRCGWCRWVGVGRRELMAGSKRELVLSWIA